MAEIFISYAREDLGTARRLAAELQRRGWSVFWDRRIPAGRRFAEVIAQQLESAKCVIALWSAAANSSDWVLDEASEALERNILTPARIEAVKPPMGFRRIHAADLIGWNGEEAHEGFQQLLEDIAQYAPATVCEVKVDEPKAGEVRINPADGQPYVWIPPGEFQMGCSPGDDECFDDEKPSHAVRITRGFWLGQTPVTVGAYKRFCEMTRMPMPDEPVIGQRKLNPGWSDLDPPMVMITWTEAKSYCESWAKGRLPTEAEWEYAARAGNTASRYGDLDSIAWYADSSGSKQLDSVRAWERDAGRDPAKYSSILERNGNGIRRVKQKQPNAWGLYDILGNVYEWVQDWYRESCYQTLPSPALDPKGPQSGTMRVVRGGSWNVFPRYVRASNRGRGGPEVRDVSIGFRCVREVIP
jgi:formylglycine-generating enzyme required for sulfatase activity